MADHGRRRIAFIAVLVTSLIVTLTGRLYYVQIIDKTSIAAAMDAVRAGTIVLPAPRGDIVDDQGRC
jgi:penicillin-binding protein 2